MRAPSSFCNSRWLHFARWLDNARTHLWRQHQVVTVEQDRLLGILGQNNHSGDADSAIAAGWVIVGPPYNKTLLASGMPLQLRVLKYDSIS